MRISLQHPLLAAALFVFVLGGPLVAQEQPDSTPPPEPGLELLDQAMQTKLGAVRLRDLEQVVELCEQAIDGGLSEENQSFAQQLMTSTLYEQAERLVEPVLRGNIDQTWARRREMALQSLRKAIQLDEDNGDAYLLLAKLCRLPRGDLEAGRAAAANAVELLHAVPARRAEALIVKANFAKTPEERIKILDEAIAADEGNFDAWRSRGDAKLDSGDSEGAIADFKQVLDKDEGNLEALEQIVRAFAANREFDEAINHVNKVIEIDPESPTGYAMRSSLYVLQDKSEDALDDLDTAVDLDPSNLVIRLTRAQMLQLNKDYDEAFADIDRVLEMRPGLQEAVLLRADVAISAGLYDDAILAYKELLEKEPENAGIRLQLAAIYAASSRPRRAIELYSELASEEDEEIAWRAMRGRADARLGIGEHAAAVADYDQALKFAPEDDGILNNLAWVLSTSAKDDVRDGDRGLELAKKACELTEYKEAHILSTLAACHAELGDFEEARSWSAKAVELGSGEVVEHLSAELKSYQQDEPWRELQEQEENPKPEPELGYNDDLTVDDKFAP
jgi:tetratricopeptide (TPR) repeat protein